MSDVSYDDEWAACGLGIAVRGGPPVVGTSAAVVCWCSRRAACRAATSAAWHGCSHGRPRRVDLFHRGQQHERPRRGQQHRRRCGPQRGQHGWRLVFGLRRGYGDDWHYGNGERDQPAAAAFHGCTRAKPHRRCCRSARCSMITPTRRWRPRCQRSPTASRRCRCSSPCPRRSPTTRRRPCSPCCHPQWRQYCWPRRSCCCQR